MLKAEIGKVEIIRRERLAYLCFHLSKFQLYSSRFQLSKFHHFPSTFPISTLNFIL